MSSTPPKTLGAAGSRLWRRIVPTYSLRPDELATLEDACTITDMIAELEQAWVEDGRPMTARGSTGQLIIHPLIGEIRTQRMARNALWRQLKLPDLPDAQPHPRLNQQREAASSRWAAAHGKAG